MARPTKFTAGRAKSLIDALRTGNTRTAAAGYAGIDYKTLTNWIKRYPEFSADVVKAEADAEVRNVSIIQKAVAEHWQAAAWWLERRRHKDWRQRKDFDVRTLTDDKLIGLLNEYAEEGGEEEGSEPTFPEDV